LSPRWAIAPLFIVAALVPWLMGPTFEWLILGGALALIGVGLVVATAMR